MREKERAPGANKKAPGNNNEREESLTYMPLPLQPASERVVPEAEEDRISLTLAELYFDIS